MIIRRTIFTFFTAFFCFSSAFSQEWIYNFGLGTGYYSTDVISTSFMPQPQINGGIAMVYAASAAHGGGIYLNNPGIPQLGQDSELKIVSSPGASTNKFSIYGYQPSKLLHTSFEILVGNQDGMALTNAGEIYFLQGQGQVFTGTGIFSASVSQSFVSLRWLPGSNGSLSLQSFQGNAWTSLPNTSSFNLQQGVVYTVEIFGNNGFENVTYYKNGLNELMPGRWALWINGSLLSGSLRTGGLIAGVEIDSWGFSGERAGSSGASLFVDNVSYSGQLPLGPVDPLPVELLSFTARAAGNQVNLEWITATETNNDYFTIEKSADARNFAEVDRISGAAFSNSLIVYRYSDFNVGSGIWYYRIRQTDFDGAYTFSPVVAVNVTNTDDNRRIESLSAQNGSISFIYSGKSSLLDIKIINAAGAIVASALQSPSGDSVVRLSIPNARKGIYFLKVTDESGSESRSFYLQ